MREEKKKLKQITHRGVFGGMVKRVTFDKNKRYSFI